MKTTKNKFRIAFLSASLSLALAGYLLSTYGDPVSGSDNQPGSGNQSANNTTPPGTPPSTSNQPGSGNQSPNNTPSAGTQTGSANQPGSGNQAVTPPGSGNQSANNTPGAANQPGSGNTTNTP